jgi:erythronate-4-phosphate dehydrogenase
MKIVADENIPYVKDAFAALGEVLTVHGRSLTRDSLEDAELLLVRSVTKVNSALLDGARVRFVATATIGEDHIDKAYLATRGIAFASAPGSNADSVADYLTGVLLELAERYKFELEGKSLGIVGVGNVGSRVMRRAEALGMRCVLNDPPLARITRESKYRPLDEVMECDFITFHVPLIKDGPDKTRHLVNASFLERLKPEAVLINTSRGSVIDNFALKEALVRGRIWMAALDVWEGEPNVNRGLLEHCAFASPHIAGYSFDGKVNGTRQIYEAACQFLNTKKSWDPSPLLPPPSCREVHLGSAKPFQELALAASRAVYDFRRDDEAMRSIIGLDNNDAPVFFDKLRKEYPVRREFKNTAVILKPGDRALSQRFSELSFKNENEAE